ncbi:MAG: AP2 domain-containing protein [Methanomassiliicoccales archaeon]|jgi:hypothetical protein
MIANSGFKSVSRMDYDQSTQGWLVKIYWKGKWYRKYFADAQHGGKKSALKEAVTWRDETEIKIKKPQTDRVVVGLSPRGVMTGIQHTKLIQKKNGKQYSYPAYVVYWFPKTGGKKCQTSFSIKKFGKQKALLLARQLRQKMYHKFCLPPRSKIKSKK